MNNIKKTPDLSIIVIVYNMPTQAMNTLYSLSSHYQKNVEESFYEVIVIENKSTKNLCESGIKKLGENFRYYCRNEKSTSPAPAVNFGISLSKGKYIGLILDGARMVTPRVIEYVQMGFKQSANSLIAVPSYNLGPTEHHLTNSNQYTEKTESRLLDSINWKENGYRLFDIANLSGANTKGPLQLLLECNCIFTAKTTLIDIGCADERFNLEGGGSLNLHLYRKLGTHPNSLYYFVLCGEGSFHQLHNGVTTSNREDRTNLLSSFKLQLDNIWGGEFGGSVKREPILLGALPSQAIPFILDSCIHVENRFEKLSKKRTTFWLDDEPFQRLTITAD